MFSSKIRQANQPEMVLKSRVHFSPNESSCKLAVLKIQQKAKIIHPPVTSQIARRDINLVQTTSIVRASSPKEGSLAQMSCFKAHPSGRTAVANELQLILVLALTVTEPYLWHLSISQEWLKFLNLFGCFLKTNIHLFHFSPQCLKKMLVKVYWTDYS